MQRRRSADLLAVASHYPNFPILLETYRECLRDVFDIMSGRLDGYLANQLIRIRLPEELEKMADALRKISAGATLVQVYTGFIYAGPQLVADIAGKIAAGRAIHH